METGKNKEILIIETIEYNYKCDTLQEFYMRENLIRKEVEELGDEFVPESLCISMDEAGVTCYSYQRQRLYSAVAARG